MRSLLLLAIAFGLCSAYFFKFEAHHAEISHSNLLPFETRHSHVKNVQNVFQEKIRLFLNNDKIAVTVKHVEVHGAEWDAHTAIIYGFLDTTLNRDQIAERFKNSQLDDFKLYYLEEIENIPAVDLSNDKEVFDGVDSCKNDGVLFPNATCICAPFFSGSQCETPLCLNGGILCEEGKCVCPPGYQSEHCESKSCAPSAEDALDLSSSTLFYVVSLKDTMAQDLNDLIPQTKALLSKLNTTNPGYFKNYVLTKVLKSKTGLYMKTEIFTDSKSFYNSLLKSTISGGIDSQPMITAMMQTVQRYDTQKANSFMYIFTDSTISDASSIDNSLTTLSAQNQLVRTLLYWHIKVFFVISDSSIDPQSSSFAALKWITVSTHGDVVLSLKNNVGTVAETVIPIHINSENIFVANGIKCTDVIVQINSAMVNVNAYVYGGAALANIAGQSVPITSYADFENMKIYQVNTTATTSISVTPDPTNTDGICAIRVFEQSKVTVLNGFATNTVMDNGNIYAIEGMPAILNVAVVGGTPTKISFKAVDGNTNVPLSDSVDLTEKTGVCTMGWQGDTAYKCKAGPITGQVTIHFKNNLFITRYVPSYCFTTPSVKPAPLVCKNGGKVVAGKCGCTTYWTGNVCQTPVCLNGGTVNQFLGNGQPFCFCPTGFLGDHCNVLKCDKPSDDDIDVSTRTLAVVVRSSFSMAAFGSYVTTALNQMAQRAPAQYYEEYVLTTFNTIDAENTLLNVTKFTDQQSFTKATTLQYSFSSVSDQPIMSAIWETMIVCSKIRSALFIFVDAPIKAESNRTIDDVKQYAISRDLRLNFVIADPFQNKDQCLGDSEIKTYQDLAFSTGGVILNLCHEDNDYSNLITFLGDYATTYDYQMETYDLKINDCSKGIIVPFIKSHPSQKYQLVINSATQNNFKVDVLNDQETTNVTHESPISTLAVYSLTNFTEKVSVYIKADGVGSCFVRVLEKSQLSVFMGFSTNPTVDRQLFNPLLETAMYPVIRPSSALQSVPNVTLFGWDKKSNFDMYISKAIARQQSCTYDYYSLEPFACSTPNQEFFIKVTLDTPEITIIRTLRSFCRVLDNYCMNNGTFENNKCQCQKNYTGKNCEIKQCANGAVFLNGICKCAPEFTGEFCELGICDKWDFQTTHSAEIRKFRTIAFALEKSKANLFPYIYLAPTIDSVLDKIEQVDVNVQYALVVYDNADISLRVLTPHRDIFANVVKSACAETPTVTTSAEQPALTLSAVKAIHELIASPNAQNPALINVLMASPSDKPPNVDQVNVNEGTQINFIYTYTGNSPVNILTNNFDQLYHLAYITGGRFLPMIPGSAGPKLGDIVASFIHQNGLLADFTMPDCTKGGGQIQFNVERAAEELIIEVVGLNAKDNLVITDGAGKTITIPPSNYVYADKHSSMYKIGINDTFARLDGLWSVSAKTTAGRCQFQARVHSPLHVLPGFTTDAHSDFPYAAPFAENGKNKTSYVTIQIPGFMHKMNGTVLNKVQLMGVNYNSGDGIDLGGQVLLPRDPSSCANQFITVAPANFDTTSNIQLIVLGTDLYGSSFQRYSTYLNNKNSTCQNGGVLSDYGNCICATNYTGALCTLPICQNGGTRVGSACLCPMSYYGIFCEKNL